MKLPSTHIGTNEVMVEHAMRWQIYHSTLLDLNIMECI